MIGRMLCFFGLHLWRIETMSLDIEPQEFFYCTKCKLMHFNDWREQAKEQK